MSNFWLYNPTVLFDKEQILEIWPKPEMELARKLNAITRIVVVLTIIGIIITRSGKLLVTSIITLVALVILYKTQYEDDEKDKLKEKFMKEGFESGDGNEEGKFIKVFRDTFTNPTKKNPMMNVLMSDYKYDPKKKRAAPAYNNNIRREINQAAKPQGKLFKDLGDSLAFENTMRNFYSMPNTTIPNDQKAFAEFCFGEMTSCKEGNTDACAKVNRRIGKIFY
jgi:hypothetical protein